MSHHARGPPQVTKDVQGVVRGLDADAAAGRKDAAQTDIQDQKVNATQDVDSEDVLLQDPTEHRGTAWRQVEMECGHTFGRASAMRPTVAALDDLRFKDKHDTLVRKRERDAADISTTSANHLPLGSHNGNEVRLKSPQLARPLPPGADDDNAPRKKQSSSTRPAYPPVSGTKRQQPQDDEHKTDGRGPKRSFRSTADAQCPKLVPSVRDSITAEHMLAQCRLYGFEPVVKQKELEQIALFMIDDRFSQEVRHKVLKAYTARRAPDPRSFGFALDTSVQGAHVYCAGYEAEGPSLVRVLEQELEGNLYAQCAAKCHREDLQKRLPGEGKTVYINYSGRIMTSTKSVDERAKQHITGEGSGTVLFSPAIDAIERTPDYWLSVFTPEEISSYVSKAKEMMHLTTEVAFEKVMDVAEALAGAVTMSQCRNGGFQAPGGGNAFGTCTTLQINYVCFAVLNKRDIKSYVTEALTKVADDVTTAEADAMEEAARGKLEGKTVKELHKTILDAQPALPCVQHDQVLLNILYALATAEDENPAAISLWHLRRAMCRHAGSIFYERDGNGKVIKTLTGRAAYQAKADFRDKEARKKAGAAPHQHKSSSNATVYKGDVYRGGYTLKIFVSATLDRSVTVDGSRTSKVRAVITHGESTSFAPGAFSCTVNGVERSLAAALDGNQDHPPFDDVLMRELRVKTTQVVAIQCAVNVEELRTAILWYSPHHTRLNSWIKANTTAKQKCAVRDCLKWAEKGRKVCSACCQMRVSAKEVVCRCCTRAAL